MTPKTETVDGVEYWYDAAAADWAAGFFPKYLRFTAGEWAGRPFVLADWEERDIIRPLFGWKRRDGTRRYRRCYVWIPRKNGKTELAAGVGIILEMGDGEPGAQVLSIATDKNQASLVFDKAVAMIGWSPELQQHLHCFKSSIYCAELQASFKALAGIPKGKHGLNMSGLVGDEIHEWSSDRLYQFVHQSSASRRQPLEFLISTAGEMTGYGWEAFQMCRDIMDGTINDPETLVVMYGADADMDKADADYWKRPETWAVANPNYGVSVKPEYLAAECRKAQRLPRLENDFKRYHLNLWVEQATRWLPMDAWRDCGQLPAIRARLREIADTIVDDEEKAPAALAERKALLIPDAKNNRWRDLPEAMRGRRCFIGVDLSSTTDLTAVVLVFPPTDADPLWTLVPHFYVPRATMRKRIETDKVPYDLWERMGALTVTDGNVVDYEYVKRDIFEDAGLYRVDTIAIDQFLAAQIAIQLNAEGLNAVLVRQGFLSLSGPSKELETSLLGRMLDHGGHPVLTWCARNVATERDAMENIKPSKKKSTERIDGIVAAVMGLGVAMQSEPDVNLDGFLSNPVIA